MGDAGLIYELNSDPEVTKFIHEPLTTREKAGEVLTQIILPQYQLYHHGRWAVHLLENDAFIGWCGLKYRPEKNEVDLGYRLKKKYWGYGYATEAGRQCLDYGFNTLKLTSIVAAALKQNLASQQVLIKLGFLYMGEEDIDGEPAFTYIIHPR